MAVWPCITNLFASKFDDKFQSFVTMKQRERIPNITHTINVSNSLIHFRVPWGCNIVWEETGQSCMPTKSPVLQKIYFDKKVNPSIWEQTWTYFELWRLLFLRLGSNPWHYNLWLQVFTVALWLWTHLYIIKIIGNIKK